MFFLYSNKCIVKLFFDFSVNFLNIQHNSGHVDLSSSPDTTFTAATYSCRRKLSMVTNLLPQSNSTVSDLDHTENSNGSNNVEIGVIDVDVAGENSNEEAAKTQAKCDSQCQRDTKPLTATQDSLAHKEKNRNIKNIGTVDNSNRKAGGYLIAVHRKLSRQDTYFLSYHKTRPSLFGVPLLIPCYEDGTNKDLYCAVWIQVARLLSPLPSTPPDQANHATDW